MLSYNTIKEDEITPDRKEQFIIKIDDVKQSMGRWYSLFALRIIPFLLFAIPVNVVIGHMYSFLFRYSQNINPRGTILLVSWIVAMLGFLAVAITAPKAATVVEFVFGFAYLFFAFRHHLFNNALGYSVLIGMILFLLVKMIFLGFSIMRLIVFSGDKRKNIERDESGRVVRAVSEDIYFIKNDVNSDSAEKHESDDEFCFVPNEEPQDDNEAVPAADDEFFFAKDDNSNEESDFAPTTDNDFFFG